ncbi:uncharacterized protein FTJAE_12707 [Fusarium tjaetaba]|uniref:Uncharacterized protein n=1 Tax=Fusarium tjaetaba TaxID=1567544 RepID=A0A8H5VCS1_9HYPO|nr:uncharacterized protein FTJAE_12707 [Fusarium tjaetaba]KAF5617285.1 hypothetical protein FTJAE_12707 [Fusarium tjaetaba]
MFDRIRGAIICLTSSDDTEIRNKLDEVTFRRAGKVERREILDAMGARRRERLHERIREYDNNEKYLREQHRKQKEERKKAAKAQAAQKKNSSESFPYGPFKMVPAGRRRLVGGQASIEPGNEIMTQREKDALVLTLRPLFEGS